MQSDQVRVTAEDREAAEALCENAGFRWSADHLDMALDVTAQAFARHRLAHSTPPVGDRALREALEHSRNWLKADLVQRASQPLHQESLEALIAQIDAALAAHPAPVDERRVSSNAADAPSSPGGPEVSSEGSRILAAPEHPAPVDPVEHQGWQPIETAPYSQDMTVRVGEMTFRARLVPDVSQDEHGNECDQWRATREGEHPPCWTDGACWASNADEVASIFPETWMPLPAAPEQPK